MGSRASLALLHQVAPEGLVVTRKQLLAAGLSGAALDRYVKSGWLHLVGRGAYRLQDDSGELWVVSDRGVPRTGARVSVKGTIRDAFNLGILAKQLPPGVASGLVMIETSHSAQ